MLSSFTGAIFKITFAVGSVNHRGANIKAAICNVSDLNT